MTNTSWRNALIVLAVIIIGAIAAGIYFQYYSTDTATNNDGQVEGAAQDDGSSVQDGTAVTVDTKLNETARAAGVAINPTEIVEDSRCPSDVQCIQAGTVRVSTMVTARGDTTAQPVVFEVGIPMTVGMDQITLVKVSPDKKSTTPITAGDYVFTFTVVKGGGSEFYKG